MIVDFGGGIKRDEDIRVVFEAGAKLATIGSVAVKQPELFLDGWSSTALKRSSWART